MRLRVARCSSVGSFGLGSAFALSCVSCSTIVSGVQSEVWNKVSPVQANPTSLLSCVPFHWSTNDFPSCVSVPFHWSTNDFPSWSVLVLNSPVSASGVLNSSSVEIHQRLYLSLSISLYLLCVLYHYIFFHRRKFKKKLPTIWRVEKQMHSSAVESSSQSTKDAIGSKSSERRYIRDMWSWRVLKITQNVKLTDSHSFKLNYCFVNTGLTLDNGQFSLLWMFRLDLLLLLWFQI